MPSYPNFLPILLILAIGGGCLLMLPTMDAGGNNKTPKERNDQAAEQFAKCCNDKGITCPEVCTYPPPDFSLAEQWCLMKWNADFIACYTGGKNNTDCCEKHGVVGIYGICRDYCEGTTSHSFNPGYVVCGAVKEIISKCNHDAIVNDD